MVEFGLRLGWCFAAVGVGEWQGLNISSTVKQLNLSGMRNKMPLKINPVKVKQTYYLLVPKDIANMNDIEPSDAFTMTAEKNQEGELTISYKKKCLEVKKENE